MNESYLNGEKLLRISRYTIYWQNIEYAEKIRRNSVGISDSERNFLRLGNIFLQIIVCVIEEFWKIGQSLVVDGIFINEMRWLQSSKIALEK